MGNVRSIVLIIIILILIGTAGFLTYLIANGQDPLVLFNSNAAEDSFDLNQTEQDLLASAGDLSTTPTPPEFTSTSPSPSASTTPRTDSPNATLTATITTTIEPTILPDTGGGNVVYVTATPTPVSKLPVAGVGDFLYPAILGGLFLLSLAFLI